MLLPGTHTPSQETVSRVRALVERDGLARASRAIGLGREATIRIAAGVGVRAGSIALVESRLPALATEPQRA